MAPISDLAVIGWNYWRLRYGLRFQDRDQLLGWQDTQIKHFLARILPRSRFYREYYQDLSIADCDWQNLPMIDKQTMMDHFDSLNTVNIRLADAMQVALRAEEERDFSPTLNGLTVGLSSGTSGNRGLFLVSKQERLQWVAAAAAKLLPGGGGVSLFAPHRIAFFLRANSNLYKTLGTTGFRFQFFDLILAPHLHLEALNALQPTLLVAPPSMLRYLAEQQQMGVLNIWPDKVISVAEVLDPIDQAVIQQAFGGIVHQVYQATEGFLASTCDYGTLHLHEDIVAVQQEFLDQAKEKFTPIITDFRRCSQPIIRYRLNDILTLKREPCACGSPMLALEQIEGRSDDLFILPGNVILFPDFIRHSVIAASAAIRAYQVRQQAPDHLCVALQIEGEHPDTYEIEALVRHRLLQLLQKVGASPDTIKIEFSQLPPLQPSAVKLRRIVREF